MLSSCPPSTFDRYDTYRKADVGNHNKVNRGRDFGNPLRERHVRPRPRLFLYKESFIHCSPRLFHPTTDSTDTHRKMVSLRRPTNRHVRQRILVGCGIACHPVVRILTHTLSMKPDHHKGNQNLIVDWEVGVASAWGRPGNLGPYTPPSKVKSPPSFVTTPPPRRNLPAKPLGRISTKGTRRTSHAVYCVCCPRSVSIFRPGLDVGRNIFIGAQRVLTNNH
jgi:hypothetical protein